MGIIVRDHRGQIVSASRSQAEAFGWTPVTRQDQQVTRGGVARGSVPHYVDKKETKIDRMKQQGVAGVYSEVGKTTIITPNEPVMVEEVVTTEQGQSIKPDDRVSLIPQYATGQFEQHPDVIRYRERRAKESYDNWVRREQFIRGQAETRHERPLEEVSYALYDPFGLQQLKTQASTHLSGGTPEQVFEAGYQHELDFYRTQLDDPIGFMIQQSITAGMFVLPTFITVLKPIAPIITNIFQWYQVARAGNLAQNVIKQGDDYTDTQRSQNILEAVSIGTDTAIMLGIQVGQREILPRIVPPKTITETVTITREETSAIVGKETYLIQDYPNSQAIEQIIHSNTETTLPADAKIIQVEYKGQVYRYLTDLKYNVLDYKLTNADLIVKNVAMPEHTRLSMGYGYGDAVYNPPSITSTYEYIIKSPDSPTLINAGTKVTEIGVRLEDFKQKNAWDSMLAKAKDTKLFGSSATRKTPPTQEQIYRLDLSTPDEAQGYIQNKFFGGMNVKEYHTASGSFLITDPTASTGTEIVPASLGTTTTIKSINVLATSTINLKGQEVPIISKTYTGQPQKNKQISFTQPQQKTKLEADQFIRLKPMRITTPKFKFEFKQEGRQDVIITPLQSNRQVSQQITKSYQEAQKGLEISPLNLTSIKFTTTDYKRPPTKQDTTFKLSGLRKGYVSKSKRIRDYNYRRKKITKISTYLPTSDLLSRRRSLIKYGKATDVRSRKGIKEFNINLRKKGVFATFPTKQQYGKRSKKKKKLSFKIRGLKL